MEIKSKADIVFCLDLTKSTDRKLLKRFSGDAQWLVNLNDKLMDTYIYCTKEGEKNLDLM